MKQKLLAVLTILIVVGMLPGAALAAPQPPDYRPVDAGPRIREMAITPDMIPAVSDKEIAAEQLAADALVTASSTDCITATKWFLILDDYAGTYRWASFTLMGEGTQSQVWVQADLAWPAGDIRTTPVVTCEQVQYLIGQFDGNIYPNEISFFGPPDLHDGTYQVLFSPSRGVGPGYYYDQAGRQIVLVSNVQDANYYDATYPNYIAGFYSPTFEYYFDRNVMTIDAYDWANRIGATARRPYLYEGIFAHEYQHLLHDDYDEDEENWINEGLADWAMGLVGYGVAVTSHLGDLIDMPENSLVAWEDQGGIEVLADYGLAYMYQQYMFENYGGQQFIQKEFYNPLNGISSVNDTLAALGKSQTFADTYHEFAPALYTKGAFKLTDLKNFQINVGHPGKPNPEAFATVGAPPWGADYHLLWGYERIANFQFNGYQFNPTSWTSDGTALWGGAGDLIDNWAIFEAPGGGTLTFDTMFDIEFAWDYGFVQVSMDGGQTWTSLANGDTCSDLANGAHPTIMANVPGFTGVSGFGCNDPYAPTTYPTAQWITTSFNLPAHSGNLLVAFRYVTDWSYNEPGWYIKNVKVDGTVISDGSSTVGFKSLNEVLDISNDYTVLLIGERTRAGKPQFEIKTVMSGGYVSEWTSIRKMFDNYQQLVMVVIYDAPEGVTSYAEYDFQMDHRGGAHLK
ncbi:MAG TPA: hypothetical protein VK897_07830 [Anaerolineales bacterium]|nr:hypothetical protein [Anaerolineales bacterium]